MINLDIKSPNDMRAPGGKPIFLYNSQSIAELKNGNVGLFILVP